MDENENVVMEEENTEVCESSSGHPVLKTVGIGAVVLAAGYGGYTIVKKFVNKIRNRKKNDDYAEATIQNYDEEET